MSWAFFLRCFNTLMAGHVVGLCFLRMYWDESNRVRNMRVIGLGLLCGAIGWGSFDLRNDPFHPRIVLTTIGLMFCMYGMRRRAQGEPPR